MSNENVVIIYHANCPDGFGAALACWKTFGDGAKYVPATYGHRRPRLSDLAWKDVYLVDFCYDRDTLDEIKKVANSLTILDHHKTHKDVLDGYPNSTFDLTHSGAYLAWVHLHPTDTVPPLIRYIQDRDLWSNRLPSTEEVSAALWSHERRFSVWSEYLYDVSPLVTDGVSILRFKKVQIHDACKNARMLNIAGHVVPVANTAENVSEVGNVLCQMYPESPFACYYFDRADGTRQWGARSLGFDVSAIAKSFGGGGHPQAAGWNSVTPWLIA